MRKAGIVGGLCLTSLLTACGSGEASLPLEAGVVSIDKATGAAVIRGCFYQGAPGADPSAMTLERLVLGKDTKGRITAVGSPAVAYSDPARNKPQTIPLPEVPAQSFVPAEVDTSPYGFECTLRVELPDAATLSRFEGQVVRITRRPDGAADKVIGPFRSVVVETATITCESGFATPPPPGAPTAVGACLAAVGLHNSAA